MSLDYKLHLHRAALEAEHRQLVNELRHRCAVQLQTFLPLPGCYASKEADLASKETDLASKEANLVKELDLGKDADSEGQETRQKSKDAGEVVFSDNGILPDSLDPVGSLKEASDNRTTHRVSGTASKINSNRTKANMSLLIPPDPTVSEKTEASRRKSNIHKNSSTMPNGKGEVYESRRLEASLASRKRIMGTNYYSNYQGYGDAPFIQRLVHSLKFDLFAGSIILLNTAMLALETHYNGLDDGYHLEAPGYNQSAESSWPGAREVFEVTDIIFTGVFLLELLCRIAADRYGSVASAWIWFDAIIVTFGLVKILDANPEWGKFDPTLMRLARFARMMRVLRIIRLIRAFDSLYLLLKSIQASVGALIWSFVCMVSLQIGCGLVLMQLLNPQLSDEDRSMDERIEIFNYFGTFLRMLVTMFEITIGNWVPSCRFFMDHVTEWFGMFYILYTCCLCFAVVRVITAVFITETSRVISNDDALAVRQKENEKRAYLYRLKSMFVELDTSGDGFIDYAEFDAAFNNESSVMKTWLAALGVDAYELEHLFNLLDNGEGRIEIEEFVAGISRLKGAASSIDVVTIMKNVNLLSVKMDMLLQQRSNRHSRHSVHSMYGEASHIVQHQSSAGKPTGGNGERLMEPPPPPPPALNPQSYFIGRWTGSEYII